VFVIFYQGNRAQEKIKKICESFGANMYPCPDTPNERKELLNQVNTRIDDLNVVLQRSEDHKMRVLSEIAPNIHRWKAIVVKVKQQKIKIIIIIIINRKKRFIIL
jgi:V-type H+-transporting ATPase subunit a